MLEKLEKSVSLLEKIKTRKAKIAVVGLGYVGLPTAGLFADKGFSVVGVDVNRVIVERINNRTLETKEHGLQKIILEACQKGCFNAFDSPSEALMGSDAIIVCVQTPVDESGNANLSFLQKACEGVGKSLGKNTLVIIQSTVPPNTLYRIVLPSLENNSGLKCGEDFWLAYCPERLAPGNGLNDLMSNSRLIGAFDSDSAALSTALFSAVSNGELLVTNIPSAEISKLAENTFRFVNIAFANELALLCKQVNVDVKEVIRLANTHPRVNILQPGCGAGGPCLTKDSYLLLNSTCSSSFRACVIPAAIKMNREMPENVADIALKAISKTGKLVSKSKVAVLGTAYKGDVDDPRDSPAKGIISKLKTVASEVIAYDPVCKETFGAENAMNLDEAVKDADCVIIATDHEPFYHLNLQNIRKLMKDKPIIVDAKRVIDADIAVSNGFDYETISGVM